MECVQTLADVLSQGSLSLCSRPAQRANQFLNKENKLDHYRRAHASLPLLPSTFAAYENQDEQAEVEEGHKRSYRNLIRLTREEQEKINQEAEACGLPVYLLIRQRLLSGKYPEPTLAKLDVQVYLELRKIGVNINQLAKRVNSGKWPRGISATLDPLLHQQQEIITRLVK